MKSIISDIYNGNLDAADLCAGYSEKYFAAQQAYMEYSSSFSAKLGQLDPALADEFREITDAYLDYIQREDEDIFVTGFRLGAKIMLEILDGSSPLKNFLEDDEEED